LQNLEDQIEPKYRIGAIAKMSGVAIATLRVWQRRYGVVQPQKSSGGQRLFDDEDLSKLKCIKDLIDLGFAIGTLAHLKLDELRTLIKRGLLPSNSPGSAPVRLCLVGVGLQEKLMELERLSDVNLPKLRLDRVFADVGEALEAMELHASGQHDAVNVCVIKLSTLQLQNVKSIQALQVRMNGACFGVIYSYANPEVVSLLQSMKIAMLRHPFENTELIEFLQLLCASSLDATGAKKLPPYARRFSEQDLQFITSFQSSVGCECPRHIAQIVEQLGSFEQYSRECLNLNVKDQQLHKMLTQVASQSLSLFEQALQDVMTHEKIELPLNPARS
jgi:MerR family transcriptional regulator, light-induced transcriptional regulator